MAFITLLDGGMGQELVARSGDEPTPLWATRVMIDHPGLVKAIHADYFAAGASVATTNTYNILHDRLVGVDLDHYDQLNARLHRSGQDKVVRVYHIMVKDTIDEIIMRVLKKKDVTQTALLTSLAEYVAKKSNGGAI
jgi:S-methylmethionine-dependent homocysteine/selenocysteine methylase